MFTRSGLTPPKVNRFWRSLEHREYIIGGWPWQIFGAIRTVARAGEPGKIFCQVSNARFYRFFVHQISRNLNITRRSVRRWIFLEQNFENFPVMGRFSQKPKKNKFDFVQRLATSGRHNSAMITDRQKFITKWSHYGMSSFHFYLWSQFKVIPWPVCTLRARNLPPNSQRRRSYASWRHPHNADGPSERDLMTSLWEGKDRSFNKITGNWVTQLQKHCG